MHDRDFVPTACNRQKYFWVKLESSLLTIILNKNKTLKKKLERTRVVRLRLNLQTVLLIKPLLFKENCLRSVLISQIHTNVKN